MRWYISRYLCCRQHVGRISGWLFRCFPYASHDFIWGFDDFLCRSVSNVIINFSHKIIEINFFPLFLWWVRIDTTHDSLFTVRYKILAARCIVLFHFRGEAAAENISGIFVPLACIYYLLRLPPLLPPQYFFDIVYTSLLHTAALVSRHWFIFTIVICRRRRRWYCHASNGMSLPTVAFMNLLDRQYLAISSILPIDFFDIHTPRLSFTKFISF